MNFVFVIEYIVLSSALSALIMSCMRVEHSVDFWSKDRPVYFTPSL